MRQIVLDTETTGLEPSAGHRIIEIGCVEMIDRKLTGRTYHRYLNPRRDIDAEAMEVHGITNEFLADKPLFEDIITEFQDFIRGGELLIHNAPFDVGFMNKEFSLVGNRYGRVEDLCGITDTLAMARKKHPGQKNNLDALCRRYMIVTKRELHGALLDSEILADVYLAMTGGQTSLLLGGQNDTGEALATPKSAIEPGRFQLTVVSPTESELEAHEKMLSTLDKKSGGSLWRTLH
jgi:DNA polymerase-3 subunit epsilon